MSYVFISYSRNDSAFANLLATELRRSGVQVWVDKQEILPGSNWAHEIEKAIENASAYVLILSNNSLKSPWVRQEAEFAYNYQRRLIPILLESLLPDTNFPIPLWLTEFNWLSFDIQNFQESLNRLLNSLPHDVREEAPVKDKETVTKGYIFISYVDEDDEFVDQLIEFFDERQYGYWDFQRSDRDYQSPFHIELEKAISNAAATLCVISPEWKRSIWTPKEYLYSEQVKTPTIVLMHRDAGPTLLIADRTYIDFTKDETLGFAKLDRELKRRGLI